ncbi:ABC transporter ATP-binding protein [Parvibaculum sp.]|jgi:NitT/TauT family transport system ATP-binding protein|uniref:ABC transporter ATP-binding protein n=1 Tax=Parvibaculum sp. TaxID=2024848 RepID=UPI001B0BC3D2|nr:ABC transporter ATP-binding protein [Parvibaculum sp.]MBO6633704.1 ABC transporter ATP-binding protein [Parvibaculum sp.]MBO6678616.1 ABC transporter ATP-binding protein [Parvibaculum sp.]MBO6685625.1 ABC transporter ATP-binding protein [Parvibaculum sp.]MBO6904450.1 ABC transporter ATP-binding protein [Parvibaculum sp.]
MTADAREALPLVQLRGIGKTYPNGTVALAGVDAEIRKSGFVSLVGPSGCGKSTLLRIIAGLIAPDSGTLSWQATGERPPDIGFVFQDATLMPWARVADNVHLPLKLAGVSKDKASPRIKAALARVGLADFATVFPRELSGGMKMRVSIARALVTEPPVLLMDEPFAALDEFTREKLDDDLLDLWTAQRFTTIFVTHSIYESVYLSERILVMGARPGRILADIAVDASYPRGRAFRESKTYLDTCATVSAALRDGAMP